MSYELSKTAVEITTENNELLVDKFNVPSIMVRIPKMKMSELIEGGSENPHPAFIVNGVEKDCIYVSKYQNTLIEGMPSSMPLEAPATEVTYDEAKKLCEAKGAGWHLMTNAEWSLLALLAIKSKTEPYGNNNSGSDIENGQAGRTVAGSGIVYTGSGEIVWSHDFTQSGVYDLNGNVHEWVAGLRLEDGQIQVLVDNNAANKANTGESSTLWKTLGTDGTYKERTETENVYYYKYKSEPAENAQVEVAATQGTLQENETDYAESRFETLIGESAETLKALALATVEEYQDKGDTVKMKNLGERLARRGGAFDSGAKAGICSLDLTAGREYKGTDTGFRACYIPD